MTAEELVPFDAEFGRRLTAVRTKKEMSQRTLAAELAKRGVSLDSAALSRIETGKRAAKLHEALAIADALGTPVLELLQVPASKRLQEAIGLFRGAEAAFASAAYMYEEEALSLAKLADQLLATNPDLVNEKMRSVDLSLTVRELAAAGHEMRRSLVDGAMPDDPAPYFEQYVSRLGGDDGEHQEAP